MQFTTPDSDQLPLPDAVAREAFPPPKAKAKKPPVEDDEEATITVTVKKGKGKEPPVEYDEAPDEAEEDEDVEYEEAPEGDIADAKMHAAHDDPELRSPPKKKRKKRAPPPVMAEAHTEIHSAKAHRCVDKVAAKGGVDEPWAVCTASIGKEGVYAKGHGGRASPKRKTHEVAMDAYVDELVEAVRRAR